MACCCGSHIRPAATQSSIWGTEAVSLAATESTKRSTAEQPSLATAASGGKRLRTEDLSGTAVRCRTSGHQRSRDSDQEVATAFAGTTAYTCSMVARAKQKLTKFFAQASRLQNG